MEKSLKKQKFVKRRVKWLSFHSNNTKIHQANKLEKLILFCKELSIT
jgi:hypothetical protein